MDRQEYIAKQLEAGPRSLAGSNVGQFLTQKQYAVGPIPFHTHDNINSPQVNSNTLAGIPILYGKGIPSDTINAAKGTLYVNLTADNSGVAGYRLYIKTGSSTPGAVWGSFTASS